MNKALHIAGANLRRHKSAVASLFLILTVVSMLCTIGLSIMLGVRNDFMAGHDRLNGLHSMLIMSKEAYKDEYEDILKNDPRVTEYDVGEAIYFGMSEIDYGGKVEALFVIQNADAGLKISAPRIVDLDPAVSPEQAVYLPLSAKQSAGYKTGDPFALSYRNKPLGLTVAGFFETAEQGMANGIGIKAFVPGVHFQKLKREIGASVWIAARFHDPYDSAAFNRDFKERMDIQIGMLGDSSQVADFWGVSDNAIIPIMMLTTVILVFALVIVLILLIVITSRIRGEIDDSMHTIGVLKASGYTSGQIISSYLWEYGAVAAPATLLGVLLPVPVFLAVRQLLSGLSGTSWTLSANFTAGLLAALAMAGVTLLTALYACRRIHMIPPVAALRGSMSGGGYRRNHFPLHKGGGEAWVRLAMKNMTAYFKQYLTIGVVLASASFVMVIIGGMFQNFVVDSSALFQITGVEVTDVSLTVARHTDADALAKELEGLPEVRKTSMYEWIAFQMEGVDVLGFCSNDFARMETTKTNEGRFPVYDNEIATSKLFAEQLGKNIGDRVKVKANGVTQEYIICGYFTSLNNGGQVGAISLEGYRRLDPNYRRGNISVYFNEGVTFEEFDALLRQKYGVVNDYHEAENDRYAAAKARAEEKIANYLEYHNVDSVEYAVIYNGEIILSGSSGAYQIEKITDFKEWGKTQIGVYGSIVSLITQVVSLISLGIIALILSITVRQIVRKRRRELGIMKSGGYTTKQLARQLAMSFLPLSLIGVASGCIGGVLAVNPAMTAMFSFGGVYNANVHIYPPAAAVIGLLTLLFTFAVANAAAMKIKHITVYELLSE